MNIAVAAFIAQCLSVLVGLATLLWMIYNDKKKK